MHKLIKCFIVTILISTISTHLSAATWNGNAGNNLWSDDGNWENPPIYPNAVDADAIFNLGAGLTINLTEDITINNLLLSTTNFDFIQLNIEQPQFPQPILTVKNQITSTPFAGGNLNVTSNIPVIFDSGASITANQENTSSFFSFNNLSVNGAGALNFVAANGEIQTAQLSLIDFFNSISFDTLTLDGAMSVTIQPLGADPLNVNAIAINNPVTFVGIQNGNGNTIATNFSGTGDLTATDGSLTFTGTNSYSGESSFRFCQATLDGNATFGNGTGALDITGGQVTLAEDLGPRECGTFSGSQNGALNINNNNFTVTQNEDGTFDGIISGTGNFTKAGTEVLTFTGLNTYSGNTNITDGTLQIGTGGRLGNGAATVIMTGTGVLNISPFVGSKSIGSLTAEATNEIVIGLGSTLVYNQLDIGAVFPGVISGGGSFTKGGASDLTFTGTNTYSGTTTITGGILRLTGNGTLGNGTGPLNTGTNTLIIDTNAGPKTCGTLSGQPLSSINLNNNNLTVTQNADATFAGVISGLGGLTKAGGNNLTLNAINTYSGATNITAGTLTIDGLGTLGDGTGALNMTNNAVLVLANTGTTLSGTLTGASGNTINLNNSTLSVTQGANGTFEGVISGIGGITKAGDDNLTLTRANTYTGTTSVTAGTLTLAENGTLGDGTGALTMTNAANLVLTTGIGTKSCGTLTGSADTNINLNDNRLSITQGEETTFAGEITGTGGITKLGEDELILSGANTYSGPTLITNGTIRLIQDGTLGDETGALEMDGSGTLTLVDDIGPRGSGELTGFIGDQINLGNNEFTITQNDSTIFRGIITGTGTLTKAGVSDLTLTGNNTYSGATNITAGILIISGIGTLGNGAAALTMTGTGSLSILNNNGIKSIGDLTGANTNTISIGNNSSLIVNQIGNTTFAGSISGDGTLTKSEDGNLTLTGANTYAGATNLTAGTLTLGDAGTLGNGAGALNMSNAAQLSIAAGAGAKSCGTLTGAAGNTIALNNDNDFTITQNATGAFAGTFTGTSSLIKKGTETLNITGTSPGYTGEVNVNAGILSVNGDLSAGTLQINANGTLQGTGTVGTTTNGGNLAPGNSIGTIIIAGDYTQAANGTLTIEINGDGTSDKVTVTGDAFLDGTLSLDVLPGVYTKGTTYTILEATNVNGQFATLIDNDPLEFSAIYNAANVQVLINEDVIILSIDKSGLTGNARRIADYYFCANSIPAVGSDFRSVLDLMVRLPASQLENAILQLGPQEFGALPLANLQNDVKMTNSFTSVLCRSAQVCKKKNSLNETSDETNSLKECTCRSSGIWVKPIFMFYDQNPSQSQWGFDEYTYGTALGVALNLGSRWMLNLGGGYTYSNLYWKDNQGHANWDSIYLSPSVGYCTRSFYTTFALLSNINLYRVDRKIHFTDLSRNAENRHQGYDLLIRSEAGFRIPLARSAFFLEPEVQLNMINMFQRGYKETGADSLNLKVDRKLTIYLRPNAQMSVGAQFYSRKLSFLPKAYLGCLMDIPLTSGRYYAHAYGSERPSCQQEMCVISYYRTTTQMSYGTSFEIQSCKSFSFEMLYNSTVFSQFQVYDAKVKLNWKF